MTSSSRANRIFLAAFLGVLITLTLTVAPAFADRTYDSHIAGFVEPWGVTTDSAGHVWLTDTGNKGLVSEYDAYPSQTLLAQRDGEGHFQCGGRYERSLAVNSANDNLYIAQECGVGILRYDPLGHFVAPKWSGFYVQGVYVAIDNSGGPSNGRVYAADPDDPNVPGGGGFGTSYVRAYDPNHNLVNFEASEEYISGSEIRGTPKGPFEQWEGRGLSNVAVDNNGNIYAVYPYGNEVAEFEPSGKYLRSFTGTEVPGGFSEHLSAVAIDPTNENVLIADSPKDVIDEFSASGEYLGQLTGVSPSEPFDELSGGIAFNSNGYLYVADKGQGVVDIFTPKAILPKVSYGAVSNPSSSSEIVKASIDPNNGGPVTACQVEYGTDSSYSLGSVPCSPDPASSPPGSYFTGPNAAEISADISGLTSETTYRYRVSATNSHGTSHGQRKEFTPHSVANLATDPATNIEATSATLNGSYIGNGDDTHYFFEYGTDNTYGQTTAVEDNGSGTEVQTPSADLTGLQPLTTYHYRIVAANTLGTTHGGDRIFATSGKPTIGNFSVSNITATTVDMHADINPQGGDTHYHFEYGLTTDYGSSAPSVPDDIGSSHESQAVTAHVSNLQSGATYHFRVVAENPVGTTLSVDQSFGFYPPNCPNAHSRQQTSSSRLPDCRAYELVSPSDAGGTTLDPLGPFSPLATNPARFAFGGFLGTIPGAGDPPNYDGDLYVATRTDSGWKTKYVGLPATVAHSVDGPPGEPNLGWILINSPAGVRTDLGMDKFVDWNDGNETEELLSGPQYPPFYEPHVWAADGSSLGEWPTAPGYSAGPILSQSPDFTHYIFEVAGTVYDNNTVTNAINPIAVDADGAPVPIHGVPQTSTNGSHVLMSTGGCVDPAISSCSPAELYMRVNDAVTYDIAKGHTVKFVGMTGDASKVYFTSSEQLTEDDQDSSTDLYMWSEAGEKEGTPLVLVSLGKEDRGNSDECSATWTNLCGVAAFEDNSFANIHFDRGGVAGSGLSDSAVASGNGDIYFYSPEQLVSGRGVKNQSNLYLYRDGGLQYVTTFVPGGHCDENSEGQIATETCTAGPMARVQVSPDDSHMAFLTTSQVTPYDNSGHTEMYLYDPVAEEVKCTSCLPGGLTPASDVWASSNGIFMTNDGRTFFSTVDSLVPRDTDDLRDVYEYVEGRPQLISSGTSSKDLIGGIALGRNQNLFRAGLVGVSADGTNVYFSTYDTLVGQDRNGPVLKFYDARTNGGFPFVAPPAPCAAADECVGAGSSPPTVPHETSGAELGGRGNVRPRAGSGHHRARHPNHKSGRHRHRGATHKRHSARGANG